MKVDSKSVNKHKDRKFWQNKRKYLATIGTILGLMASVLYPAKEGRFIEASMLPTGDLEEEQLGSFPIIVPTFKYGFAIDTFQVFEGTIAKNQTLGTLLSGKGMDVLSIDRLVKNCEGNFNFSRDFRQGKSYTLLSGLNSQKPEYLVIEPDVFEYVVFELNGDMKVQRVKKEVETKLRSVDGVIENSLWGALTAQGVNFEAAAKMEDALQWSVDFSHTQKGDEFRMVYDEKYIHDKPVGSGQVYAASYRREGKDYYAFWFENGDFKGYYDLEGRPARKGFLKAPVKFTRISSNYNPSRFHPILKRVRPHLGTDYAAPHGTPIISIGDGVVAEAAFTKGNGKYVKIKHDDTYQTQYLHMSRFAKGIRKGVHVAQGEVIGYVGSSGLATGPHVCFRFWKNGQQVNHLKLDLPKAKPLPDDVLPEFYKVRDHYLMMLQEGDNLKISDKLQNLDSIPNPNGTAP